MEEIKVSGAKLKATLKALIREGNVRRVILRNGQGRTLLDMPLAAGIVRPIGATIGLILALTAGVNVSRQRSDVQPSAIVSQQEAQRQDFDWGTLYTYYQNESYGTRDGLAAVAVIRPGWEIHPPHQHAEEEYLMLVEGRGTWHLNGREREAKPGDMQYAAPWDVHGIKNTGSAPLRFVVWKWNSKGVVPRARPK